MATTRKECANARCGALPAKSQQSSRMTAGRVVKKPVAKVVEAMPMAHLGYYLLGGHRVPICQGSESSARTTPRRAYSIR